MIALSEFQRYLQSILNGSREDTQREVRDRYIPTLAELPLQVQSCASSKADSEEQQKERREQFAVLEGLRKYAPEHLLLVGKPGSGKSTSLRRLLWEEAGRCLEAINQGKSEIPPIPILIELRNLSGSVLVAIQEKLGWWLDLDEKTLKALLRDRRLLVLLDGLNELPNDKAWQAVDEFRQLCADLKVPLIITTRELGSGLVQGIAKKLEMLPLTEPQMRDFVQKRLPETGRELWRQIQGRLRELAETPLLLKLLCDVFEQNRKIPESRGDLFRREFARRYEEFKPERIRNVSKESRLFAHDILSYLAFKMVQGEPHTDPCKPSASWITISKAQAEKILATFLAGDRTPDVVVMAKAKEWLEDLLEWHLLQVASDRDRIEFHHQLFQEYYAGEWLLPKLAHLSDEELKYNYLNYLKWTEVIAFMLALIDEQDFGGRGREQAVRVVKLALEADSKFPAVDLMLGARLVGEVKPQFQEQTLGLVSADQLSDEAEVSYWLQVELLGRTRSKLALPKLRQLLKNPNLDIARKAADWIGFLGYQEAIPDLLQMLSELDIWILQENGSRRFSDRTLSLEIEIIEAIGKLSQEDAVLKLRDFLCESSNFIYLINQDIVINLLVKLDRDFSTEESLSNLECSKDPNQISKASKLLFKAGILDAPFKLIQRLNGEQDLQIHKAIIESLGLFDTDEAVSALVNIIKSPDSSIREQAAKTLIKHERVAAIDGLIDHLDNPDWDIRWYSAFVLGKLRSVAAIPILLDGLLDEHRNIRRVAAESLGMIESDEVICPLLSSLADPDYAVRRSAAISLAQFDRQEAIPELLKALRHYYPSDDSYAMVEIPFQLNEDWIVSIRGMTHEMLKQLGDNQAIQAWLLERSVRGIREQVADALGRFNTEEVIRGLFDSLHKGVKAAAVPLGKLGKQEVVPELIELLQDPNQISSSNKVIDTLVFLASLGNLSIVSQLLSILENINDYKHTDFYFSNRVAIVLAKIEHEAMSGYLPALVKLLPTEVGEQASWAIAAIQSRCQFYNYEIAQCSPPELPDANGNIENKLIQAIFNMTNNFNFDQRGASIGVNVANEGSNIKFIQHARQSINISEQDLAEAAQKIQALLNQLAQTYPPTSEPQQQTFIQKFLERIESTPDLIKVLLAGGIEGLKILCPPAGIPVEMARHLYEVVQERHTQP